MDMESKAFVEKVQWKDIRKDFALVNAELAAIVDELNPSAKYSLFKVRYPFGSEILKDGYLRIPDERGELVSILDSRLDPKIRESLGYNISSNPVSMPLKNSIELYLQLENRIVPFYGLIPPGKIFGLWRVLNPEASHTPIFVWSMTAGSRSMFMLAKIAKSSSHKKLQHRFNLRTDLPRGIREHWHVFRELSQQQETKEPWFVDVLYFGREWFERLTDKAWNHFSHYLYRTVWQGSEFWRNEFIWDMVFSAIQERRNIKPDPYITNTIRHLFALGVGAVPGFAPAINNEAGPIFEIQDAYANIYNLDYAPIIMQPMLFSMAAPSRPIYYSLEYPTMIELPPKSHIRSNKITNLCQIHYLLNKVCEEMVHGELNLEHTPYYDLIHRTQFNFYHTDADKYPYIKSCGEIAKQDQNFLDSIKTENKMFPENSPFVCGCIGITSNKQK